MKELEGAYPRYLKRFKTYSTFLERRFPCCKVHLKHSALISETHDGRVLLSAGVKARTPKAMLFLSKEEFAVKSGYNI